MKLLTMLFACLFLITACKKEENLVTSKNYFIGTWKLHAYPNSPWAGTSVTLETNGTATFHVLSNPNDSSGQHMTQAWSYNAQTNEFTFAAPEEKFFVTERLANQFTLTSATSGKGLIYIRW